MVDKEAMLLALCSKAYAGGRTIVFFRTKARAHRAKLMFGLAALGAAAELHGDMTQAARLASLEAFRKASQLLMNVILTDSFCLSLRLHRAALNTDELEFGRVKFPFSLQRMWQLVDWIFWVWMLSSTSTRHRCCLVTCTASGAQRGQAEGAAP